jgi:coenzyme F420 hydrogenase subunit beta
LVSQILIFALDHGIIDGALVTRMNEKKPLEAESFIARSREEILSASGSKYCPVPVNVLLRDILNQDGKFAVVGLPCHIRGVRKAEMIYEKLAKRIVLHIGLLCSHTLNFLATDFLLQPATTNGATVTKLRYRGHGWPGFLTAQTVDGERFSLPYQKFGRMHILHFFAPRRCLICVDQSCELADLSFGDAWLPEFVNDKVGRSVVVSRNPKAEGILQQAREEHIVALDNLSRDSLVRSQKQVLYFKKKTVQVHYHLRYGRKIPNNSELLEPTWPDYLLAILFNLNVSISARKALWKLIFPLIPLQMLLMKPLSWLSSRPRTHVLSQG